MILLFRRLRYRIKPPFDKNLIRKYKGQKFNFKNNNIGIFQNLLLAVFISIFIFIIVVFKNLGPSFINVVKYKTNNIIVRIVNETIDEIFLNKEEYENIEIVEKNLEGEISLIRTDPIKLNFLKSRIVSDIEKKLSKISKKDISIPLGSLLENEFLIGKGPKIPLEMTNLYEINADIDGEFVSAGINQTKHRLCVNVLVSLSVTAPTTKIDTTVETKVPISETIIIGKVPSFYMNE